MSRTITITDQMRHPILPAVDHLEGLTKLRMPLRLVVPGKLPLDGGPSRAPHPLPQFRAFPQPDNCASELDAIIRNGACGGFSASNLFSGWSKVTIGFPIDMYSMTLAVVERPCFGSGDREIEGATRPLIALSIMLSLTTGPPMC
jgi:hypothetical protein